MAYYDYSALKRLDGLTPKQLTYIEAAEKHGSMRKAAEALGKGRSTVTELIQRLSKRLEREKLAQLVPDAQRLAGTSTLYKKNEETGESEKVLQWVKTSISKEAELQAIKEVTAELVSRLDGLKSKSERVSKFTDSELLAVYVSTDLHLGQYAWHEEAGNDVDLEVVRTNTEKAMRLLIETTPAAETALVLDLGDTLHSSNDDARTKSGHSLDTDSRHAKVFQTVVDMKIAMIDMALAKHETVRYVIVAGNHSDLVGLYISAMLNAYYRSEPRFSVDTSASIHKYYKHGRTLLGFHHGHATKMTRLPEVMVWDRKEDISVTDFRYWLTGHVHRDSVHDNPIARCESFRNLTNNDAWAQGAGYRSNKQAVAITYHKGYGEIARNICPIKLVEEEIENA